MRRAGRTAFASFQPARDVAHFLRSCQVQVVRREFAKASDAELLRAGTADGFEEVYDRHAAQVLAWSRARVGEPAADLTAEVFARAWLGRSRFRHESDVSALPWPPNGRATVQPPAVSAVTDQVAPGSHSHAKRGDTRHLPTSDDPASLGLNLCGSAPPHVHGRRVDGSSPSEGLTFVARSS